VLGFVGKDDEGIDKGYFGLEGFYDLSLAGKPGYIQREADGKGAPILIGGSKEIAAVAGVDIKTNIDKRIQFVVEDKLKLGIEKYGAKNGVAIIMDPKTGKVLSLAAYPAYDPGKYNQFEQSYFKNPAISDSFEPGSIFKPLIMAAGLDAGKIDVDTKCDICSGPFPVDKYFIKTWNNVYNPNASMTDIIVHSDNVGMTFIGQKLGMDKLYDYVTSYGFGQLTGIDLQGEATPQLRPRNKWNIVDQATTTFGQGIAVTPIQMVKAFSAIANKGKIAQPQIVDKILNGANEQDVRPQISKQVISEKAAAETTAMMVEAVEKGEAQWTKIPGFKVAGKTGTAQIPVEGHYDSEKTIASFIGFAPASDPKFVMLVMLREPKSSPWAAETAAPLWFGIAKELFPYMGIQPEN
ncbi:penicillin-binding protein 2, partial [Candidatus Microgenomates bacterium]|nr:penicillin-binding protein 2 [Candidatus Microgenomates bacterium]